MATACSSPNIPYPLYGLNSGDNLAHFESDASFMSAFGQLGPSLPHYRGGNWPNWFDLSTGFLPNNPNPRSVHRRESLLQTNRDRVFWFRCDGGTSGSFLHGSDTLRCKKTAISFTNEP